MIIEIKKHDDSWLVEFTPEFAVGGFTSEQSAGAWLATYIVTMMESGRDKTAELMRAALIASDPRGKAS